MTDVRTDAGSRRSGWWVAGLALVAVVLFGVGGAAAHVGPPTTTYSVAFFSHGLPAGSTWSVYFNGVTYTSTKATITVSGVSATNYYYSASTAVSGSAGTQYAASTYNGYMNVPYQLSQWIVYTKQSSVTIGVTPSGTGYTSPGTNYYNTGETFPVSAIAYTGYTFVSWTASTKLLSLGSKTAASTNVTIGAAGTLTAKFKATSYPITYTETGLPTGSIWSVTSGGTTYNSATSTIQASTSVAGYLYYTASPVSSGTSTQYAPSPASGNMNVPYQTMEAISFVKQYQVTVAASPSSTGSTTPSGTAFYNAGSNLSVVSFGTSSYLFTTWSATSTNLGIGAKANASTNVTVKGPGTITGHFGSGSACTTCTVTFYESGLPAGAGWGISYNGSYYPSLVTTTTNSIKLTGLTSAFYWTTPSAVTGPSPSAGVIYAASTTGGYMYVPSQLAVTIVYTPEYYVALSTSPQYGGGSVGPASGYYPAGSNLAIATGGGNGYVFSKWTASTTKLVIAKSTAASTTVLLNGPGSLLASFVLPTSTVTFTESGLPTATTWAVGFDGVVYTSSSATITIKGVGAGSHSWGPGSPIADTSSTQWSALAWNYATIYGTLYVPGQIVQNVVYQKEYLVNLHSAGTSGGSVSPSGLGWYISGWTIAVSGINGTSATFKSWGSSSATLLVLASTSQPSTYLTIKGAGSVTCTFV
jgi:hypothetical protein